VVLIKNDDYMNRLRLVWTGILFSFWMVGHPMAQSVPEYYHIQLSKPFYLTGESVWGTIYLINEDTSVVSSRVIYLDFLDKQGNCLVHQKLKREGRSIPFRVEIPLDWEEDWYALRVYSAWNLNFDPPAVREYAIPVYSSLEPPRSFDPVAIRAPGEEEASLLQQSESTDPGFRLNIKREAGELIRIQASQNGQPLAAAEVSVSIVDLAWLPNEVFELLPPVKSNEGEYLKREMGEKQFEPEQQLQMRGEIRDPESEEPVATNLLSLHDIYGQWYQRERTTTGEFNFSIPECYGDHIFQLHNLNPYQAPLPKVILRPVYEQVDMQIELPAKLRMPEGIKQYVYLYRKQRRLREIFEMEAVVLPEEAKHPDFTAEPDLLYKMNDYEQLETVEEFIREVMLTTNIRKRKGEIDIYLFDPVRKKHFLNPAWFVVDSYITPNVEAVLKLPKKSVERLEVYLEKESIANHFDPALVSSGAIAIYTLDKEPPFAIKESAVNFIFRGFESKVAFEELLPASTSRQPDFRPQVWWESALRTNENGAVSFTYRPSNANTTLLVVVEGVSPRGEVSRTIHWFKQ
jgi:hypothetical protein